MSEFSTFVKNRAYKELRLSLRELAKRSGYDPSNLSKILSDLAPPPQDIDRIKDLAKALEIEENTLEFENFLVITRLDLGKVPDYILKNKAVMKSLPAFFRTVNKAKPTLEEFEKIIQIIENGSY